MSTHARLHSLPLTTHLLQCPTCPSPPTTMPQPHWTHCSSNSLTTFLGGLLLHLPVSSKSTSSVVQTSFCTPNSTVPQYAQFPPSNTAFLPKHFTLSNTVRKKKYIYYAYYLSLPSKNATTLIRAGIFISREKIYIYMCVCVCLYIYIHMCVCVSMRVYPHPQCPEQCPGIQQAFKK